MKKYDKQKMANCIETEKLIGIKNNTFDKPLSFEEFNKKADASLSEATMDLVRKFGLNDVKRTRNNFIYQNEHLVLVRNKVTGVIKLQKRLY